MENIIMLGYEIGVEGLAVVLAAAICAVNNKKKGAKESGRHILCMAAFVVYIVGVFHFTGAGTMFDADIYGVKFSGEQMNLIPFSDRNIDVLAYVLNIVLFIPLGFLLPFIWRDYKSVRYTAIFGGLLSLLIEMSQLLNNRRTDIDDLILNIVGTLFGFLLFSIYRNICVSSKAAKNKSEAIIYVLAIFLGRFFLFNELGAAKLLFRF